MLRISSILSYKQPYLKKVKTRLKIRFAHAVLVLGMLISSACGPKLTPVALPTSEVIAIQVTPALMSLDEQFYLCAEEQTAAGFVVLETPAHEIRTGDDGFALRWGALKTPSSFTAQIGTEEIAVIVPANSPLQQISLADLQEIYQGRLREWKDASLTGEIQPWAYTSGDDAQEVFQTAVLDGATISARVISTAPDPAAMREAVASSSGAIGFLPGRWINEDVRALTITGLSGAQLRQPILMISKSEPKDPERSWLLCLQEHLR